MGNLMHYSGSGGNTPGSPADNQDPGAAADGYASEDFVPGSSSSSCRERKKGRYLFFLFFFLSLLLRLMSLLLNFVFLCFLESLRLLFVP